ncbi:MAG: hypothetical protein EA367_19315 [Leptolyngbya sp. DLM2.Bin15]|nr:MAG: hypothetical protein EA367_19315 [Leptolyngbya sp. DLM2.Bin15]
MVQSRSWRRVGVGVAAAVLAWTPVLPLQVSVANEPAPVNRQDCTEQRGYYLGILLRNTLLYNSDMYARTSQFELAAQSLNHGATLVPMLDDPSLRSELVAHLIGRAGGQPSTLDQLLDYYQATQQTETLLPLLEAIAVGARSLTGGYGVINNRQATLVRLAQIYHELGYADLARIQLDEAQSSLAALQGDGYGLLVAPMAETYAALGDSETAIALLDPALTLTRQMSLDSGSDRLAYQSDIFSTLATAYARAGEFTTALQIVNDIQHDGIRARTLIAIANDQPSSDPSRLIDQAAQQIQTLTPEERSPLLGPLALGYGQAGQWDTALRQVDQIQSAEVKIRILSELAALQASQPSTGTNRDLLAELVTTAQGITPFYDGDRLIEQAAQAYIDQQHYDLALQLSQQLDETLKSNLLQRLIPAASRHGAMDVAYEALAVMPPGWENQLYYLGLKEIVAAYAQAGQYDQALTELGNLRNTPYVPSYTQAQIAIAQAYGAQGNPEAAVDHLNQALQSMTDLEAAVEQELLITIAGQFARLNRPQEAIAVQTRLLAQDNYGVVSSMDALLDQYLRADHDELAVQLVQAVEAGYGRDRLLYQIFNHQLNLGDYGAAASTAEQLDDDRQKIVAWLTVVDYYTAAAQPEPALALLAQATAIATALDGVDEDSATTNPDRAAAMQMDGSIPYRDPLDRGTLIESIAMRYAELRDHETAIEVSRALRSPLDQNQLQQRLICYRD